MQKWFGSGDTADGEGQGALPLVEHGALQPRPKELSLRGSTQCGHRAFEITGHLHHASLILAEHFGAAASEEQFL